MNMSAIGSPAAPLPWPARNAESHKGDHGRVVLVGGSRGMSGSIALAAMAALRSGSGLVSAIVPDRCLETVAGFDPCLMTLAAPEDRVGRFAITAAGFVADRVASVDAIGVGPGMATGPGSRMVVRRLAELGQIPRVFDADALNLIASLDGLAIPGPAVLTPHPGELQRLTGVSAGDRGKQIRAAVALAGRLGVVVVLKGAATLVTDGTVRWFNETGNAGMATGGSGDCLTGIITSLLGQRLSPYDAARLGVYVHGLAGDFAAAALSQTAMTAADILRHLPPALSRMTL